MCAKNLMKYGSWLTMAILAVVVMTSSAGSSAFAQNAVLPTVNPSPDSQPKTLPPVPPRLSRQASQYFESHPAEWQQLMAKLPPVLVEPPKVRPATSPWQPVTANAPAAGLSAPLLLTDGTVIVHQFCTQNWYKLTPSNTDSYVNGTWSKIASLPNGYGPLYFAAQVLSDGRVIINGGEYNESNGCNSGVWTNLGAIYNPATNAWKNVPPPSGWSSIGDAQSIVLANGKYMLANALTTQAALLNASTLTWSLTGSGKFDVNDEEGWTLLPDTSVLTTDAYVFTGKCGTNTERYNPATGTWSSAGNSPVQLSDCGGARPSFEVGPQVLRANGDVVAFSGVASGVVAGTAIYKTSTKAWAKGPNLPTIAGQNYTLADAPATWLTNGKILFAASPGLFNSPTHFFEFSTANTIAQVADTPNSPFRSSYTINFLVLPTGQILATDFSSSVEIYTPSGTAIANSAPIIASVPTTLTRGKMYQVSGRQLNGLTEGAAYGDDAQSSTNFPLVRITNKATGHVFYAKTSGFSTRSVAPNATATAKFLIPAAGKIETGASSLVVVANGVPSTAVAVMVN